MISGTADAFDGPACLQKEAGFPETVADEVGDGGCGQAEGDLDGEVSESIEKKQGQEIKKVKKEGSKNGSIKSLR